MKLGDLILAIVVLFFAVIFLPRIIAQISASNAALNAQYSPGAAWNRVQAGWINSAGGVGSEAINIAGNYGLASLDAGLGELTGKFWEANG
jgi:hypothetical protein